MTQRNPVRILCVDDHVFLVEGLQARLSLEPDMEVIGRLESADRLVEEAERLCPDVVLLDIEMPGADPFEALADLKTRSPNVRVIMFSAYVRDHYIDTAVQAGAWGYLSKSDTPDEVVKAIRTVMNSTFAFGPKVLDRCQVDPNNAAVGGPVSKLESLTPREKQVLRLIGQGLGRNDIAKTLHRSPKTIDNHRAAIMEKLDINDRVELARFALRVGLSEL